MPAKYFNDTNEFYKRLCNFFTEEINIVDF